MLSSKVTYFSLKLIIQSKIVKIIEKTKIK